MMGIDIDGLGNHNFDRSADFLRTTLIPLANYPFVSANIVDDERQDADGVVAVAQFKFEHGTKIGIVGFSNDDIPSLTKPGALDPFHVANSLDAVNAEAARIAKKVDAVVAIGHLGATAGTLTSPTGPARRPGQRRVERRRRDRRPHRPAGADDDAERRAHDREPEQGPPLHARAPRDRPRARRASSTRRPTSTSRGTSASRRTRRSRRRSTA